MQPRMALKEMDLELPDPPQAQGLYEPITVIDRHVYLSGQLPIIEGELTHRGKVGRDLDVEEAKEAARNSALNALSLIENERILNDVTILKLEGYVASTPDFTDHSEVINGASRVFVDVMGDLGRHARTAIGVNSLPMDSPVEIYLEARL